MNLLNFMTLEHHLGHKLSFHPHFLLSESPMKRLCAFIALLGNFLKQLDTVIFIDVTQRGGISAFIGDYFRWWIKPHFVL